MSGVGEHSPLPRLTVPGLLALRRSRDPGAVAIDVVGGDSLTFEQWDTASTALAATLRHRGVVRGDAVGLVFANKDWTWFAVAYCGVQKAGAVAVPLHDTLPPTRLAQLLAACGAVMAITGQAGVERLIGASAMDGDDDARPDDVGQILFTSGTSGEPKGVTATHANLTTGVQTHPRRMTLAHSQRFLHAFPIGTNAAQTMLMNALSAKPSAVTLPRFTPRRFAQRLPEVGTAFLVPAMAIELLDSGALDGVELGGVHLVGSTAAPLPPAIAQRLARAFPRAAIVNYYTSTEAAPAQTSMIFDPTRPDAVGRVQPGVVRITDPAGSPLPDGEIGEVWLRSPHARRYLGDDAATGHTFQDGWVRMGDLGRLRDGYLYLADRDGDVVKSGAYKISTLEVEAALHEHPSIAEAAVVGVPHPVLGTQLAAVIVPRPTAGDLGLAAVRAFLAERLAEHQLPGGVVLLDQLPRNDAGKVLKRQLGQLFPGDTGGRQ
ncbi:acyl-CoA synthetase (AMP-forming)/AMP-acid ligase II [Allocatelliglobosispora scoriae]|uniref:Acyl-CoA synthetase (AMP-forming)/AMP-acid ligase II n=1 Tax=Allocatelliglobosispora scoriae TaxID=643052 RepID=A0A841C1E6_9ACTN|nr:class I adenylate-forming enzyme family protein [Allocatelliglobosispora scoriae]MBB5873568.1 acyl-CoA synthetase (AMP-forming)/AMP-acid ligase II [Allocatelliglobosispora scoriae]